MTDASTPLVIPPTSSSHPSLDRRSHSRLANLSIRGTRILWLESTLAWGIYGTGHIYTVRGDPNTPSIDRERAWSRNIRELVQEDAQKPVVLKIDTVVWLIESGAEPTAMMWQALDGLSPKHLHLVAGFEETCFIAPMKTLQCQWTQLDSFSLNNVADSSIMDDVPEVLSSISYLSLDHCYAQNLVPPCAFRLKHLRIVENNACDMFLYAVDDERNPDLAKQLEILEIETTNGRDMSGQYEPQGFKDHLKECTNLRKFRFTAGIYDGLDIQLASYLPSSVENLAFVFTHSYPVLRHFEDWIQHASDPAWLPHLKSLSMTIRDEGNVRDLQVDSEGFRLLGDPPSAFTVGRFVEEFEAKRTQLYEVLKFHRPSIELLRK